MVCFKEEKEESISCEKREKLKNRKQFLKEEKQLIDFSIHFRRKDALTIRKKKIEKRKDRFCLTKRGLKQ
jgi:hypothetical protein